MKDTELKQATKMFFKWLCPDCGDKPKPFEEIINKGEIIIQELDGARRFCLSKRCRLKTEPDSVPINPILMEINITAEKEPS